MAARRAGITLFLVPDTLIPSELVEARRLAGPVDRLRSNFIAGMKRLPVTVSLA